MFLFLLLFKILSINFILALFEHLNAVSLLCCNKTKVLCLIQGRKRSGTDTAGSVWLSTSCSKLNQMYGVEAWASWVKMKTGQSEQEQESGKFTHMGQNMESFPSLSVCLTTHAACVISKGHCHSWCVTLR